MSDRPRSNRPPPQVLCPTCGELTKWQDNPDRPFCSERCQLIDRGAWAEERYAIPTADTPPADNEGEG